MPMDWSKLSDEELMANAPSMGAIQPAQPSQTASNATITMPQSINPETNDVVFKEAGGIVNRPGAIAIGQDENRLAVEKQQALMPGEIQQAAMTKQAQLQEEEKAIRKRFQNDLKTYITYDRMIPRGNDFLGRHLEGLDSFLQGQNQSGERGVAVNMHGDMISALKTPMAKLLGNLGNLNINETKSAEQLFSGLTDSQEVADAKNAFLIQLVTGIENQNPKMVKQVINNFMGSKFYDKEANKEDNDVDLDELLPPVDLENFKL